jgi:hypothetical protein
LNGAPIRAPGGTDQRAKKRKDYATRHIHGRTLTERKFSMKVTRLAQIAMIKKSALEYKIGRKCARMSQ